MFPEIGKLYNKIFVVWTKDGVEMMNILYYVLSPVCVHAGSKYFQFAEQKIVVNDTSNKYQTLK